MVVNILSTDLYRGHLGGQPQAQVIPMNHDDATNHARAHAKASLEDVLPCACLIQELCAKGLGKVGAQVVCCACLKQAMVMH